MASDEVGGLGGVYVLPQQATSCIQVPPPLIQKCLDMSARGIESVYGASRARTGYGSCAIRVICAACGSARSLVLQLVRHSIPHPTTLIEVMMLIVANLKACR